MVFVDIGSKFHTGLARVTAIDRQSVPVADFPAKVNTVIHYEQTSKSIDVPEQQPMVSVSVELTGLP